MNERGSRGEASMPRPDIVRHVPNQGIDLTPTRPEPEGPPVFDHREVTYLQGIVSGKTRQEIGDSLGISRATVGKTAAGLNQKLDSDSALSAVVSAVNAGIIPAEKILEGFETERFTSLTDAEFVVIAELVRDNGKGRTNEKIAEALNEAGNPTATKKSVESTLGRISDKLGTHNKEHTAAVYAAATIARVPELFDEEVAVLSVPELTPREKDILTLRAQGMKEEEIAEATSSKYLTVKDILFNIRTKQDTHSSTESILTALDQGDISPDAVLGTRDPSILRLLLPDEEEFLDDLVADNGVRSANKQITRDTALTHHAISGYLDSIEEKFGTNNRFHTVAVYKAAKMLPDLSEMTDRHQEVLDLFTQGQTPQSISTNLDIPLGTIQTYADTVRKSLRGNTTTQVVVMAVERGIVPIETALGNRPPTIINTLDEGEVAVMDAVTQQYGKHSSAAELRTKLSLSTRQLYATLGSVADKLGTTSKAHSAAVFLAARKAQRME